MDVDSLAELLAKLEVAREDYQRAYAAQRDALFSYTDEPRRRGTSGERNVEVGTGANTRMLWTG